MAEKKYYAWGGGTFTVKNSEGDSVRKRYNAGEELTATKLGISKAEFAKLVACGHARTMPYPAINLKDPNKKSPIDFFRQQLKEAELALDPDKLSALVDDDSDEVELDEDDNVREPAGAGAQ